MRKIQLEKNCLDLEYQKNLQYLNAVLIVGAGSLVAYSGALILNVERWVSYTLIVLFMTYLTILSFVLVNKNLKEISEKIKNLKIQKTGFQNSKTE